MTAKSQPMAGQPDAADDLIAELAKLMAQDSPAGERPAAPAFSVRIPGGDDAPRPMPAPRFDFEHSSGLPAAGEPQAPRAAEASAQPEPVIETPEPFHFDFGLGAPKQPPTATPAAVEVPEIVDHDSIADLIAAELAIDPQPAAPPSDKPTQASAAPQAAANWTASHADLGGQGAAPRSAPQPVSPPAAPRAEPTAEPDRFKVAPVFGLGSGPAPAVPPVSPVVAAPAASSAPVESGFDARPPAPAAPMALDDDLGSDPIDEIENLIGRAMRVEFDRPAEPVVEARPAPSPALRSLATPTVPAASAQDGSNNTRMLSGADEAIMAAAQATGAEIGWVDTPEADYAEPVAAVRHPRAPRALGMTRAAAGPLVAVTLLLAAGFGLYWVLGLGRDAGPAPLLTADATPSKQTPAIAPEAESAPQSIVFNEINGVVPGAEEQLVSRDQADVNEVTQTPPAADVSEEGLANRKVRTVTVRPDGTIVSGDDSVAGSTILPVARPNVPEVPGAEAASLQLPATTTPEPVATPTPEPAAILVPVTPGSTVPAVDLAGNPVPGKTAPVPLLRPVGLVGQAAPTSPVNAVVDTPVSAGNTLPPPPANSLLSAPPAQPVAAIPQAVEVDALPNDAPAYVQLASQRSEADARASAQAMVTRFGPLFGGANMEVQRVDLGERGIYYRVRVPANSLQDANNICTNVKAAGGDCFTM